MAGVGRFDGVDGPLSIMAPEGFEQVAYAHDGPSGLQAIVAIHSTVLGPSLGGTRFWPFASEEEALVDVCQQIQADSEVHGLLRIKAGDIQGYLESGIA